MEKRTSVPKENAFNRDHPVSLWRELSSEDCSIRIFFPASGRFTVEAYEVSAKPSIFHVEVLCDLPFRLDEKSGVAI